MSALPLPQALIDEARGIRIESVIAERHIKLSPGRAERCGPCPRCGGTDRFSINLRKQVFNCRGCRDGGDVIRLVQFLDGSDFPTAVKTLAAPAPETGMANAPDPAVIEEQRRPAEARQRAADDRDHADENTRRLGALAIWRQSIPEDGAGLVARYLRDSREIVIPPDDWSYLSPRVIRFHPRCSFDKDHHPAMVCLFRNVVTDAEQAIFRIALTPSAKKIGKGLGYGPRGTISFAGLAAIKLFDDADVDQGLVLAEGVETALAAAYGGGYRPVWAMAGTDGIAAFPVLAGIDGLMVSIDNDRPGRLAFDEIKARWKASGKTVHGIISTELGEDMNGVILSRNK